MGQEFSLEDIRASLKLDETLDQIISSLGKRIKRDSSAHPDGYIVYTRHRTRNGAPTINRWSYGEEVLKRFEVENDGFPFAATEEEIRQFDKALFTGKQPKQRRSWAKTISEGTPLASLRRLQAPSRPKFIDKLLLGASNLTKKSSGKHKSSQSPDSSKFYFDLPDDQSDIGSDSVSQCSSSFDGQSDHTGNLDIGGHLSATEDQIVLVSDPEDYEHTEEDEVSSQGASWVTAELEVPPEGHNNETPVNNHLFDYSLEEIIYDINKTEPDLNSNDECLTTAECCTSETNDSSVLDASNPQENTPEDPPIVTKGFVKRQCQVFLNSLRSTDSSEEHITTSRRVKRSSSDLSGSLHGHLRRPLSPHSESPDRWSKGFHNISRNSKFTEAVMAKGYVKALTEQINQQGALKLDMDEEIKMDKIEDLDEEAAFLAQFKEQSLRQSFVKDLIQAAESQSSKENTNGIINKQTAKKTGALEQDPHLEHISTPSSVLFPVSKTPPHINGDSSLTKSLASTANQPHKPCVKSEVYPSHNFGHHHKTHPIISPKHSPNCSPRLPKMRSQSVSSGEKPPVDYNGKPKVPPKKLSLTPERTLLPMQSPAPSHESQHSTMQSPAPSHVLHHSATQSPAPFHESQHSAMQSPASNISSSSVTNNQETSVSSSDSHPTSPVPKSTNSYLPKLIISPVEQSTEKEQSFNSVSNNESSNSAGTQSNDSHQSICSSPSSLREEVSMRPTSTRSSQQYRDSVFNTIYDNAPPINAAELFDSSWSDSDSLDEISDDEESQEIQKKARKTDQIVEEVTEQMIPEPVDVKPEDKRFRIASELLQTEKDYVSRLHLLHQIFYFTLDKENRQQQIFPPDTLRHMFSNTKSIFLFHHDFLLPQLEDRMKNWKVDPRIGDLMKKNAPFLKMYTEYIRNFDCAMKLINQWMEKSARFAEIIRDIQKKPECGSLSLQHHMLGPIQRVPRYEMLLKDYVKHLPEDSPDKSDAKDALDLVTKAACHSNEAMKKIETFHKLLDIYQSLRGDVPVDFISPTREFITQGPVTKISARSGEKQPRQIILFNDMVLVCAYILGTSSVRSVLEVDSLEVKAGNNMHIPNTFMIRSKQKAVELLDENPSGEVIGWKTKFEEVIANYKQKKRFIISVDAPEEPNETSVPESCLGKTAPVWIPDDAATMCMLCQSTFNMVRRRHHCRSCGKLICKSCCKKAPLEYKKGKIERVCSACYDVIVNKRGASESTSSDKKKGVLQVKASDPGLLSGYMHCSNDNGVSWPKLWVSARNDFALYTFRAHEDVSAIGSLPLPGHEVMSFGEWEGRQNVFGLKHKNKIVFFFQADNEKRMKRWVSLFNKLVMAELPEESSRLSTQSSASNASSDGGHNTGGEGNNRNSTHSGSQADSGYPGDSNSSLAALAAEDIDHEGADGVSQYDNIDSVVSE